MTSEVNPNYVVEDDEVAKAKQKKRTLACLSFAIVVLLIATTVGLLVHFLRPRNDFKARTEAVGDCLPISGASQSKCEALG